jgi:hypothetical protein
MWLYEKVRDHSRMLKFAGLNEETQQIESSGFSVLLSDFVVNHVKAHNRIGTGSVFRNGVTEKDIVAAIRSADIKEGGGVYTIKVPHIGYNLVLPFEEAKKLPDAEETQVEKEERGKKISVPAFRTSKPLSAFATNQLNIVIRPSNPQFLPDDVKNDAAVKKNIDGGKSYSVLAAYPGDSSIPATSQWEGKWAVVLPKE